ncbi:hypothetical protein ACRYCC_34355 [Actinomadura scrupuli]|uniref:hypothetical protein n=1 Tax=Actinomadura scrupuli TaxID=559629 RepID=UPI003D99697E
MSLIVSELLFCAAIAAALAGVFLYRRTSVPGRACSPQERQLLVMLARDEIDEEEFRHRRATARLPRPAALTSGPAHPNGAHGGLTSGEVTP